MIAISIAPHPTYPSHQVHADDYGVMGRDH